MSAPKRILVFQTAFLGDVILTLPMVQQLHAAYPDAEIDMVTTPGGAGLVLNHPAIHEIIRYDKRGAQKGLRGIAALGVFLGRRGYDLAVVPHRSFRTSLILLLSGIPKRIGFDTASLSLAYHHTAVHRKDLHEVERNLALLTPLGITTETKILPSLYPSEFDVSFVERFLFEREILEQTNLVAIAPGSVWATKRWLPERFAQLAVRLAEDGLQVLIVGGKDDEMLGRTVKEMAPHSAIHNCTGKLSLLQSSELIRRCRVLVTNDSAPLHMAVGVRTPVIAIFGATVPAFGFAPYGDGDRIIETNGLECRPCAIHGGTVCPIGTFECMKRIEAAAVHQQVIELLAQPRRE